MSRENCRKNKDKYCHMCAQFILNAADKRKTFSPLLQRAYTLFFGFPPQIDKSFAPNALCQTCARSLSGWIKGDKNKPPFLTPATWRDVFDHQDCFFCSNNMSGINSTKIKSFAYTSTPAVSLPVNRPNGVPVPRPPPPEPQEMDVDTAFVEEFFNEMHEEEEEEEIMCEDDDPDWVPDDFEAEVPKVTQAELNDLMRTLSLSIEKSEYLASWLDKRTNCLDDDVRVNVF